MTSLKAPKSSSNLHVGLLRLFPALCCTVGIITWGVVGISSTAQAEDTSEATTFEEAPVADPVVSEMAEIAAVKEPEGKATNTDAEPEAEDGEATPPQRVEGQVSVPASEVPEGEPAAANSATAAQDDSVEGQPQERPLAEVLSGDPIAHETLIEELLRRMSSPDERTRLEAGLALRKSAILSDVENLVKVLKRGNNKDKQLFIIETLGQLQDRRAGEALRFEVEHGDIDTKRAAVTALGNLNYNWPIPVLVRVLRKADDEELRKRAASALGQIGTAQAIYALRTSLATLDQMVGAKNAAFSALERSRGEIDEDQVDTQMPRGRRLQLYYKGTKYYFYHPANRRGAGINKVGLRPWLLVCVHDSDLRAEDLFNICWRSGKKRQMAVLVPVIDNTSFPEYGNFNIRGQRFDKRLLDVIEHVGKSAALTVREIYMFGYGQGGDFVQRFSMAYPKRIARAVFEGSSFTAADPEAYYPRGLNRTPLAMDIAVDMYQFMKTDIMIVLRKNSDALGDAKEWIEGMSHFSDVNGIRSRLVSRTVDVKFEIWAEAEKFLFSYD